MTQTPLTSASPATPAGTSAATAPGSAHTLPRPEHPRPDFVREPWLNLNGLWRFTFDPQDRGEQLRWYRVKDPAVARISSTDPSRTFNTGPGSGVLTEDPFGDTIVVPFPWESRLSGISEPTYKGIGWYQRVIQVPADWAHGEAQPATQDAVGLPSAEDSAGATSATGAGVRWGLRPHLCFGAVDWNAKVWVDGRFVAEHEGGYTPFSLDLSNYVRPGRPATLTVRVLDTSAADTPIGKQTERWYTSSSGIWQTVSLEGRPAAFLSRVHITPHLEVGTATFQASIEASPVVAGQAYRVTVTSRDDAFPAVSAEWTAPQGAPSGALADDETQPATLTGDVSLQVSVPSPRAWSPEDPHLYDCQVTLSPVSQARDERPAGVEDRIQTYFGLRSISKGAWEGRPYEFVLLNGEPVYLRGALDQAFHPDGLHAYPSDEAIRADVQAAKDLGLNLLRCHIKINDPRYYYWCDRLGVLCMYDFPSASIYTPRSRANWESTFRQALDRDFSHPSIIAWILFNETWGLEEHQTPASWQWVKRMFDLCKGLDPSRLVEDNSACLYDHVDTDINTWHFYVDDWDRARRHVDRVVKQTYEGSPFNYVSGLYHYRQDAGTYKQGTQPLLNSEYAGLSARQGDLDISYSFKFLTTELRRHDKVCGYVYTELTDIEWEHNGFLNYDRSKKEFGYGHFVPGMTVADLNGADFVGLDVAPCSTLAPGSTFTAPMFVSHWDRRPLEQPQVRWYVTAMDRFGETHELDHAECPVKLRRYGVSEAGLVEVQLPDEPCLVTVAITLVDGDGAVRARNYVNVDVSDQRPLPIAEPTPSGYALRFSPGDFVDSSWPNPRLGPQSAKFSASGAGWVDYAVQLPPDVTPEQVQRLRVRFEAGARTARSRIGWNDPLHVLGTDYPQTDEIHLPSDLRVSLNGTAVGRVRLPDDPADARGVLSAHNSHRWEYASYGFLNTLEVEGDAAQRIAADSQNRLLVVRFEVPRGGVRGGLNLYGARMGAYPVDPVVLLDMR